MLVLYVPSWAPRPYVAMVVRRVSAIPYPRPPWSRLDSGVATCLHQPHLPKRYTSKAFCRAFDDHLLQALLKVSGAVIYIPGHVAPNLTNLQSHHLIHIPLLSLDLIFHKDTTKEFISRLILSATFNYQAGVTATCLP